MPIVLQVVLVLWLVASPVIALVIGVGIARADRIMKIRDAALAAAVTARDAEATTDGDQRLVTDAGDIHQSGTERHPETKRLHLVVPQRDGADLNG